MSKNRKRSPIKNSEIDIALLSCGLVDLPVFEKCVDAIVREVQGLESQVYVYLNGAPKEVRNDFERVCLKYANVNLKQSTERVGFPVGANRVIKYGNSPLVLFITDDVILHPGSLKILVDRMKLDSTIGLCGMKLIFPEDSTDPSRPAGRVQHIGHGIDIRGKVTHPLIGWSPDNPKCNVSREVLSVTGGVFITRRNAFLRSGGFWEGYGTGYYEDIDLNITLRDQGWKIWVEPSASATHYTNMSMSKAKLPPIQNNESVFISRKGDKLVNDNWTFW